MRVLLVDDEPSVLQGVERALFHRDDWEIFTAKSGREALDVLEDEDIEVIVTDIRMPGMDGVELLQRVQYGYPHVLRMVLSGQANATETLNVVPVAHRFLSKPFPAESLERILDELAGLAQQLADPKMGRFVRGVRGLPVLPTLLRELQAASEDPQKDLHTMGEIVRHDIGCSAKLLQIVNAPFFGMTQPIRDIGDAVSRLGSNTVMAVVTALETFKLSPDVLPPGVDLESLQSQSFAGASLAQSLADGQDAKTKAFSAALLSDVGLILLMDSANAAHHRAWRGRWPNVFEVECAANLVTHADVASYLLGLWGLPADVVEAVRYHHEPERTPAPSILNDIVHIATAVTRGQEPNVAHLQAHGRAELLQKAMEQYQ